jgi:hypothetical protein
VEILNKKIDKEIEDEYGGRIYFSNQGEDVNL